MSNSHKDSGRGPNWEAAVRQFGRGLALLFAMAVLLGAMAYHPSVRSYADSSGLAPNCFASPGSCGYPDPAYNNVGVSDCSALPTFNITTDPIAGTFYSGSGSLLEITSNNVTISNLNMGDINIYVGGVSNFTLDNVCLDVNGAADEGSSAINIAGGSTGTTIKNSTISGMNDTTKALGTIIDNEGSGTVIDNDSMYNAGGGAPGNGSGNATVEDSYELVNAVPAGEHDEDVYFADGTVNLYHDTLLNEENQTAVVFGDTNGGIGGACDNHLTAINNLLAGGDYAMYPCGNATSVGTSTTDLENNRFARCGDGVNVSTGGVEGACVNGPDSHGYYPYSGGYGLIADFFTGAGQTWCGNYWDDSASAYIAIDGNPGNACAAGSAPTVSITGPGSGATVSGVVTLSADATATNPHSTMSSVQFEIDGKTVGMATTAPFAHSLNTTGLSNGSHLFTALATDSNGDSSTNSEPFIITNVGASGTVPKTPDTGLALIAARPAITLLSATLAAGIILAVYRRVRD